MNSRPVCVFSGKKCNNADDVSHSQGTETAKNGGMKKGGYVASQGVNFTES